MPIKKKNATAAPEKKAKSSKSEGGSMSKADAFAKAKASGAVAAGKYTAVIAEFVLQKEDEKGQSARVKYAIVTEGDEYGHTVTQWYKLFEADETPARGLEFLKKDLLILGHDDVQFDDLEDVFEEITQEHPGVAVTVKHNDTFVNVYLQGLVEDSDEVADYLEKNPF